jgi:Uma2 family endonuclease
MTLKTAEPISPGVILKKMGGTTPATVPAQPDLPTFDLEVGWKYVYDPETNTYADVPLTLLDILYPQEDDGVQMPQSPHHDRWIRWLAFMLNAFLGARDWLILTDVVIHWGRRGAPAKSPDLAAIPGGRLPDTTEKSYRVNRDGPVPAFVLEITSEDTRPTDLQARPLHYAAVGVREYLVIDFWPEDGGDWRLSGYRLGNRPYYDKIAPDPEGGLTFETLGLRFVAVGRERIEVYDAETGERLLTPDEMQAHAEAEAEARAQAERRAEVEAEARAQAEARIVELEARLQELQARYEAQVGTAADASIDEEESG